MLGQLVTFVQGGIEYSGRVYSLGEQMASVQVFFNWGAQFRNVQLFLVNSGSLVAVDEAAV